MLIVPYVIAQATQTDPLIDYLDSAGFIGLLLVTVVGGLRGWWWPGFQAERQIADRDAIIARLLEERNRALALNEKNVEAIQRALDIALRSREGS